MLEIKNSREFARIRRFSREENAREFSRIHANSPLFARIRANSRDKIRDEQRCNLVKKIMFKKVIFLFFFFYFKFQILIKMFWREYVP